VTDVLVISDFAKTVKPMLSPAMFSYCNYGMALIASKASLYADVPRSILITSVEDRGLVPNSCAELIAATKELERERRGPVVLTGGAFGCAFADRGNVWSFAAPLVMPKFTVGAGDWLVGAWAAHIDLGAHPLSALQTAVSQASGSVEFFWIGSSRSSVTKSPPRWSRS
jgi:sugar/nucleoside kinase (ribokinase family)